MLSPGLLGNGMRNWKTAIAATIVLLAPGFPSAAANQRLIEKAEMSMLVTGGIDMRPDGSVERYSLDHPDKLSQAITQMIGAQVSQWRFEPTNVDGKPVAAHTNISLRIVAKPVDEQNFNVRIQSASFSGGSGAKDERISVAKKTSLAPMVRALMSAGTDAAELYLALKIGKDGQVLDAVVEQVNLYALGDEGWMAQARKILGKSAVYSVRQWTFAVPAHEPPEGEEYWSGTLPISFQMGDGSSPDLQEDEEWRMYIPGPCAPVPWRMHDKDGRCGGDAAPEGVLTLDSSGPKLLTPLMQG